ncbi:MAG: homoserine O-acetyltransferase [Cyclobacteriaceae bacterium]|nr:homoserine O-acetyltransferase [Cyclobacteriaceae bacterium]
MEKHNHTFHYNKPFELESGEYLPGFQLRYTVLGNLNADRSNVVWVCHALTGNSDFTSWWGNLFLDGSVFDPKHYLVICANTLGGCYGSTGPLSVNPKTGKPYYHSFPAITNRDIVRAFDLLRQSLGFEKIHTLIGGSLGGQQVLEWAILQNTVFEHIVPVACNAVHSPWSIAFNEAQRMAILADATWKENDERAGTEGLKAARAIAMLSYRNYEGFAVAQSEESVEKVGDFRAAAYQQYQGEKLALRFNAFTYWTLSKVMDSHNVARGRKNLLLALQSIRAKTQVIGVESDLLFPLSEQKFLAEHIIKSSFAALQSTHGHDGFLIEFDQFASILKKFYTTKQEAYCCL